MFKTLGMKDQCLHVQQDLRHFSEAKGQLAEFRVVRLLFAAVSQVVYTVVKRSFKQEMVDDELTYRQPVGRYNAAFLLQLEICGKPDWDLRSTRWLKGAIRSLLQSHHSRKGV